MHKHKALLTLVLPLAQQKDRLSHTQTIIDSSQ